MIAKITKILFSREFITFGFIGVGNTLVHFIVYIFFKNTMGVQYLISGVVAFFVATMVSYFANSKFTFHDKMSANKANKFLMVNIVKVSVVSSLTLILTEFLKLNSDYTATLAGIMIIPLTFVANKFLVFQKK